MTQILTNPYVSAITDRSDIGRELGAQACANFGEKVFSLSKTGLPLAI